MVTVAADNNAQAAAMSEYWKALRSGLLVRPDHCESCRKPGRVDGHHSSYSEPLRVTWLCRSCHRRVHGKPKPRMQPFRSGAKSYIAVTADIHSRLRELANTRGMFLGALVETALQQYLDREEARS
jgi:uncharacterized protein YlaI